MHKSIQKPLTKNEAYAQKNKINLNDFLRKTEKDLPEVDEEGYMIVDRDDPSKRRWLEE